MSANRLLNAILTTILRLHLSNLNRKHLAQIRFCAFACETLKFGKKCWVSGFKVVNMHLAGVFIA